MRERLDQADKGIIAAVLDGAGTVTRQVEVGVPAQTLDTCFVPDPSQADALADRGVFGRLARDVFSMEVCSSTPGVEVVQGSVRKHLGWHHLRTLQARKEAATPSLTLPTPRLCVVSSGRPASVIAAFRIRRVRGWPTGVYDQSEALGLWVVVLSELPRTRDTLALWLMGRGAVWRAAVEDLKRLPDEAWERKRVLPVLVEWRLTAAADFAPRDPEAEMDMATGRELFEAFERQAIEKGIQRGMEKGIEKGIDALVRQFERRLSRPLTVDDRATLRARFDALGPTRLADVVLDLDAPALAAWLADPDAR